VYKLELDDLFKFIEDELNLRSLLSVEDSTLYSSSSSEEEEEDEKVKAPDNKNTKTVKKVFKKDNMQKKFFNIELRLRAYLKEQSIFKTPVFDSFLNESKLRTPISKMSPAKLTLPAIIKNFFEDRAIIEEAKKRYSVREDLRHQIERLGNAEELFKCKSNYDRIKVKSNYDGASDGNNVSTFSIDTSNSQNNITSGVNNTNTNTNNANNSLNFSKRDSIFKDRYFNDFGVVEEVLSSEDDINSMSDEEEYSDDDEEKANSTD
jgi:hypothetical protein